MTSPASVPSSSDVDPEDPSSPPGPWGSVSWWPSRVATVYLGWHFVTDVVAGLALAALAVLLGQFTVQPWVPRSGMPAG